jgi:hypothetical protein
MDPDYERHILEHRELRAKRTAGPDGWLTVVGLSWLVEGENAVGSDPLSQVRLPADKTPARVGTMKVSVGRSFFWLPLMQTSGTSMSGSRRSGWSMTSPAHPRSCRSAR